MRQNAAANREAIVAAARRLLLEQGPGISMRTIAAEAGVGVATATRHFPNRIMLLEAISAQAMGEIETVVNEHVPDFAHAPEAAWRSAVHAIGALGTAACAESILADFLYTAREHTVEQQHIIAKRAADIERIYGALVQPAAAAGLCPTDVSPLDMHLMLGIVTRPLPAQAPATFRSTPLAADTLDILLDGLKAQARAGSAATAAPAEASDTSGDPDGT